MKKKFAKIFFILMMLFFFSDCSPIQENTALEVTEESIFTHSVYFWLANPDSLKDRAEFESAIKNFIYNSAYVQTKYLGTPAGTPREVVDNSWTYNLIVTFNSEEDHDLYQAEEVHDDFRKGSAHLWTKVQIYDGVRLW